MNRRMFFGSLESVLLPEVRYLGRRFRLRLRLLTTWHWARHSRCTFPEGTVHRYWLGPILAVCMVDDVINQGQAKARG